MTHEAIILKTQEFLKDEFSTEASGHDYWHMYRVWRLAKRIATKEGEVDMFTLELAALLHDVADWKFHDGDEEAGPRAARRWLEGLSVSDSIIQDVEDIICNISFKGTSMNSELATIEGRIVHDADRLDALGAIGIARVFAMGAIYNEMFL